MHFSRAIGGSIESAIVHDYKLSVRCCADVEFKVVSTSVDRGLKGSQRVLGVDAGALRDGRLP